MTNSISLHNDCILCIFSHLPFRYLNDAALVCKLWNVAANSNEIWGPHLKALDPWKFEFLKEKKYPTDDFKIVIRSIAKEYQERTDSILRSIDTDAELTRILDVPATIEGIWKMHPSARTLAVLRALRIDATPLYSHLARKGLVEFYEFRHTEQKRTGKVFIDPLRDFPNPEKFEKHLLLLLALIQDQLGPFDGSKIFCALSPYPPFPDSTCPKIFAAIITSLRLTPEFFESTLTCPNGQTYPSKVYVLDLMPVLTKLGVTENDLLACGMKIKLYGRRHV